MKNKVLAMLLALCMVMSLLPVSVFAQDTKPSAEGACGKCGCTDENCNSCVKPDGADAWTCTCKAYEGETAGSTCNGTCKFKACDVEGCADNAKIVNSEEHTTHTFTCECPGECGEDCCSGEGTYTGAAKRENGLCDDCVAVGGGTGDDTPIYCSCTSNDCHSATHTRGEEQVKGCANEVEEDGVCRTCQLSIEATQAAAAAATRDCDKDDNAQGSENCKNKEHTSQCPMACGKGGCTLTKNHTGDHNNTQCLNGGANCGAKTHELQCDKYELSEATLGMANGRDYVELKVNVDCACEVEGDNGTHDDYEGEGQHDAQVEVTVKFYFEYEWPVVDQAGEPLSASAIELQKKAALAEKRATYQGNNPTAEDMPNATALKEMVADEDAICAYCKAANKAAADAAAAEEEAAIKEALKNCTGAVTCEAGNKPEYHHDDCLSQCTMDSDCGNTVGDSAAHRIQYQVYKTTYEVTLDGQRVTKRVNKGTVADGPAYDELKDAQDYRLGLPANNGDPDENNKQVRYGYSIRAIHCPQAKVPDGVVVNEAGEVVEAPAETPEKPTKAEDFTDMEDWMAEGVQFMLDKGWMEGLGDGKFGGRDDLKTTMVLTVLARMNGETITGSTWADDAKAWAEKNAEFFEGIDLTSDNMARKDVVLVLWRQAGKPEPSADFELEFTDVEGLEGDHLTAMKWAVENKIVLGNGDGTVSPNGNINRSALSLLVMRADKASSK